VQVRLASDQVKKLTSALGRAGTREIGGQLFGEQLAPSDFRVTELTIQARPGSFARFFVDLLQAARDAMKFFDRTEHRYTRFNYIGEWHSHPSFEARPSGTDVETMRRLVRDPEFRGHFAVLMIVRLDTNTLTSGGWLFDPQGAERAITLEIEHEQ
jgi:proteasome lid subunit RPN8/RPN11